MKKLIITITLIATMAVAAKRVRAKNAQEIIVPSYDSDRVEEILKTVSNRLATS